MNSAVRLEMPPFPEGAFLEAVDMVVRENAAWVPPYGSGATLYLRPYMFASGPVIGVKLLRRVSVPPVRNPGWPLFHGAKPLDHLCQRL